MLLPQAHLHVHGVPEPPAGGLRFEVQTTAPSETFTLPCANNGVYNAVIDWGDGQQSTITAFNDPDLAHVYANAGTHEITITGPLPQVFFNNGGDKDKILRILDLEGEQTSLVDSWNGCSNLTEVRGQVPAAVTDVRRAFQRTKVSAVDADMLHLTTLTRADALFYLSDLVTVDANFFQGQSSLTHIDDIFYSSDFTTIPAGLFDPLTAVTIADNLFRSANVNGIPAGLFDNMGAVLDIQNSFRGNSNITSIPAGLLDSQINLTAVQGLFWGVGVTSAPSALFQNIPATNMGSVFRDAELTTIPADLFGTKTNTTSAGLLFFGCNLVEVPSGFFDSLINANCDWILNGNALVTVHPGEFDSMTKGDFNQAFTNNDLTEQSVDNILVSLDASGVTNGTVTISGGTNAPPGAAGQAAVANLTGKGWTVVTN